MEAPNPHWVRFSRRLLWTATDHPLAAAPGALLPAAGEHARRLLSDNAESLSTAVTAVYIVVCVLLVIFVIAAPKGIVGWFKR